MANESDLLAEGFQPSNVVAKRLNIDHPDPMGRGPFCRLAVTTTAPAAPGVYVWASDGEVRYVGMAGVLQQIVHGQRMGRAYNDYTYMPPSKVVQTSSPRVLVNGKLNLAVSSGSVVTWWWLARATVDEAKRTEAILIDRWNPPWNRARPLLR